MLRAQPPSSAHHPEAGGKEQKALAARSLKRQPLCFALYTHHLLESSRQPAEIIAFVSATSQMGKLRRPGIRLLAQGHIAKELRTQVRGFWRLILTTAPAASPHIG